MKKILAVLSVIGIATVLTGCSNMKVDNFQTNIEDFKEHIAAYNSIGDIKTAKAKVGKYVLTSSLATENDELTQSDPILKVEELDESEINETEGLVSPPEQNQNAENDIVKPKLEVGDLALDNKNKNIETDKQISPTDKQISTLYSLSSDIDDCCEDFVTLKQNLTNAIIETQNLINKVNNKEVELTNEQKLLITEQSKQLKDLGRQLARTTTELSISLSDLNNLMLNNGDLNTLSLKYMIVLDNLVNGNEMLENGLHSLNLINSMFNMNSPLPPNNTGRILYGFRRNNEDPIIKDYLIDKDGNIKENTETNNENNSTEQNDEQTNAETETETDNGIKNIDTMQNSQKMNIDSYHNNNRNVDSFFNTALLDNEFMYGNGYGYGPMANGLMYGYGNNGYNQNYINDNGQYNNQYENNRNTTNGVFNNQNTQQNENANKQNLGKQKSKKIKLTKNVDSYKDKNTPTLRTRFGKVKNAVSGFFNKFGKKNKENPVYHFNPNDDELNG